MTPRTPEERQQLGLSPDPKPNEPRKTNEQVNRCSKSENDQTAQWLVIGSIGLLAAILISFSFI